MVVSPLAQGQSQCLYSFFASSQETNSLWLHWKTQPSSQLLFSPNLTPTAESCLKFLLFSSTVASRSWQDSWISPTALFWVGSILSCVSLLLASKLECRVPQAEGFGKGSHKRAVLRFQLTKKAFHRKMFWYSLTGNGGSQTAHPTVKEIVWVLGWGSEFAEDLGQDPFAEVMLWD